MSQQPGQGWEPPSYGGSDDVPPAPGWGTPPPYGTPEPGPQYGTPSYGSPSYGAPTYGTPPAYGAPQQPAFGAQPAYGAPQPVYGAPAASVPPSTVVLTVISALLTLSCYFTIAGLPALVLSIIALTRWQTDLEGARRLTRIGWWVLGGVSLAIVAAIVLFGVVLAASSTSP